MAPRRKSAAGTPSAKGEQPPSGAASQPADKELIILSGEIKTPPLSQKARIETGVLLRQLQRGVLLGLPHSRPMPSIGPRCHELRINDEDATWRIMYRIDKDELLVLEVFSKKTQRTPPQVIENCQNRLRVWDKE